MRKIFTLLSAMLFAAGVFAATEPTWYNDVTSITNNGQYYIYSVNGKGFMQAGQSKVKTVNQNNYTSNSDLLFTITNANGGKTYNGSNYLSSYQLGTNGPVAEQSGDGTNLTWTKKSSFWWVYASYTFIWSQKAYLLYDNGYDGKTNMTPSDSETKYQWYLISQAQYDRHWAIYLYERYKETISDYTQWENLVPAAYYSALNAAYNTTYDVQNAEHSKEVVNAHRANLKTLYDNAAALVDPYATAKAAINALAAVEDKGEDFADVTTDINNANTSLEQAMSVDAINASVANLKAIDPITFSTTTFEAISSVANAASSAAGRAIVYDAADKAIINAAGMAIYAGSTTLTATAAATNEYYKFVRSAQVTVTAPASYGDFEQTTCDEPVEFNNKVYTETTQEDVKVGLNYMGGDSIVHVNVTINHATFGQDSKTITVGAAETWNGIDLSTYGVGEHNVDFVTTNAAGCDSTVTLTLTVIKQEVEEISVGFAFCEGDSMEFHGNTYREEGVYEIYAQGEERDTLYTVTVVVHEQINETENVSVKCGEAVLFEEDGWFVRGVELVENQRYATTKADTLDLWFVLYSQTEYGCLATYLRNVNVELLSPVELEENLEFCANDSVEYRGKWYNYQGEDEIFVEGEVRDTMITVILTVNPTEYELVETSVLSGHAVELPAGEWFIGDEVVSGTYPTVQSGEASSLSFLQYNQTEKGCESVTELFVTLQPNTEAVENVFAGEKAEKFFRNGVLYIRRGENIYTAQGERVE